MALDGVETEAGLLKDIGTGSVAERFAGFFWMASTPAPGCFDGTIFEGAVGLVRKILVNRPKGFMARLGAGIVFPVRKKFCLVNILFATKKCGKWDGESWEIMNWHWFYDVCRCGEMFLQY